MNRLYGLCLNGKIGFINCNGAVVVDPIYDSYMEPGQNRIPVKRDNLWGFIDSFNGKLLCEPRFEDVRPFSEGLARWKTTGGIGYIDLEFEIVFTHLYKNSYQFSEGLVVAYDNLGDYAYINFRGDVILQHNFTLGHSKNQLICWNDGLNHGYGFKNVAGEWVVHPKYYLASDFSEGLAAIQIRKNSKCFVGFIDKFGNQVFKTKYQSAEPLFHEGLCPVSQIVKTQTLFGFINTKGEIQIPFKYSFADRFSDGLAIVMIDKKYGYIDTLGELIIPNVFDAANSFKGPLARIRRDNRWGYINRSGRDVAWDSPFPP